MHLKAIASLVLGVLPFLTTAYPTDTPSTELAAAKAHNIYLVTCVPRKRNNNGNPPSNAQKFTAVAYFKKPLNATDSDSSSDKAPQPDKAALVAQPPEPWEGVKWRVKVWKDKLFSAEISADAAVMTKGGMAGSAALDDEQYVCFKDGETAIRLKGDVKGHCVADYWCAGLDPGKGDDTV
ncbi:hypothetical protein BU26DRAFT_562934 [Trematosphaeria pertusa]|uniref:Uncharacterized protein n=1 Tax=Trematosphaeria pertusa TaxID=390896 RepID=A0A6A6INB4_9PLEO|nr:uncharacterized protein BU26DRAFT_562934 [Trematosphaeria pertusa]KAF2250973.1 hypothetical protein BU26DRAFT_562934 [Trematosphaeria pertusa]